MIDMRKFKMSACVKLHSKMKGCVYLYVFYICMYMRKFHLSSFFNVTMEKRNGKERMHIVIYRYVNFFFHSRKENCFLSFEACKTFLISS